MNKLKSILALLLLLVTLFCFCACETVYIAEGGIVRPGSSNDKDDEDGDYQQPTMDDDPTNDFVVTVLADGKPYSPRMEMAVRWSDGFSVHTAPLDENGVARIDGLDGNYRVTLSAVPNEYTYDPNSHVATNDERSITLNLYTLNLLAGGGTGIWDCYSFTKTGVYSAQIKSADDAVYFQYAPDMNGVYSIESWIDTTADNINPSIDVYGGSSQYKFFIENKDEGGPVGSYTRNFVHTVTIADENISSGGQAVYTFAVKAQAKDNKYPITVTFAVKRNGGFELTGSGYGNAKGGLYIPTFDYSTYDKALHEYGNDYRLVNPEFVMDSLPGIYVLDDRRFKLNPDDGFYHVYDKEKYADTDGYGPILYAYVSKPCRFIDRAFTKIEYTASGETLNGVLSVDGYNYKHFFEGYTALSTMGNINGSYGYYCSPECTCHSKENGNSGWACAATRNEEGLLVKCPNCLNDCRALPPELEGFEGMQAIANSDGLVAVTADIQKFLVGYCKKQRFFWDGTGEYENKPVDDKNFQAVGESGWLFACTYYEET